MSILEAFKLLRAVTVQVVTVRIWSKRLRLLTRQPPAPVLTGPLSPTHAGLEDHFVLNQRPVIRNLVQILPNSVSHVPKSDYYVLKLFYIDYV